ncbi:uncharacterized protein Pyn_03117 [Prunus yedoensis var. nudiflora]|uniref:WRC domain-containing protein n=1 Tax=Prunus yedoensis var. nudiflora TaxID=2094558 RepID=A0A314UJ73_PRUYE|nr:uncharacterized protein Pyn_03117 [Prunus yedoensis var. nudiflora]
MRIRKNAKVSPLLFSSHAPAAEDLQAHVCQLNQSPWDVISFGPDSNQLEESFYVNNNGSFGDSLGAAESVASMMDIGKEKAAQMEQEPVADDKKGSNSKELLDDDNEEEGRRSSYACCQKNDGKGWHCKKRAKLGQSFCNHHYPCLGLTIIPTLFPTIRAPEKQRARCYQLEPAAPGPRRRGDPPQTLTNSITIRGLARCGGERGAGIRRRKSPRLMKIESLPTTSTTPPTQSSSSQIDEKKFEYVDDDDDDEDDFDDDVRSGESGRKRMRKPVKARSLKSLM